MSKEISVPYNYTPREYQLPLLEALDSGYRKVIWIVHRRAGKDITALNYIIKKMVEEPGVYYYIFPTYSQAKKVIWDSIRNDGFKILDHFPKQLVASSNSQEMKIRFHNGSLFQLVGSDNYDSLMGTNPKGVVFSEYALQDPKAYEFIRPILTANKGWVLFISTPRGKNHLWELYEMAKRNPEWWTEILTINDTHAISKDDIDADRADGMSEELVLQEYYCSFERGIEGSYYGKILSKMRDAGNFRTVSFDSYAKVHTVWDIGFGDSTAIWWYQLIGNEIHVVDYYEAHGEGIAHYIKYLEKKRLEHDFIYGSHYFPHDASSGSFELGMTRVKYAHELGLKAIVLPREGLDQGIERVRKWLPKCYFDEKRCHHGIRALENYQKTYNEKLKYYSDTPLHNWASHGADAFRYLAMAVETYDSNHSYSLEQHRELKRKYGVGGEPRSNNSILGN